MKKPVDLLLLEKYEIRLMLFNYDEAQQFLFLFFCWRTHQMLVTTASHI